MVGGLICARQDREVLWLAFQFGVGTAAGSQARFRITMVVHNMHT
jgi:hypothetical protein